MKKITILKIIFLTTLLFCGRFTFGQERRVAHDNEQDKKYTPNPSSPFNSLSKKREESSTSEANFKNIIKFCPTMLARFKVMFYYERQIGKIFTVNAGIGKAFGDDLIQRSFFAVRSLVNDETKLSPYDLLANGKFDQSLPYFYLGARIYFSSFAFDEGFIEFAYRYETMEYLLNPTVKESRIEGSNRAVFKMNAFSIGYGFCELMGPKNNISHEIYINFGVKFFKYSGFDRIQDKNSNSIDPVYYYEKSGADLKVKIIPAINITYCFGFGF